MDLFMLEIQVGELLRLVTLLAWPRQGPMTQLVAQMQQSVIEFKLESVLRSAQDWGRFT